MQRSIDNIVGCMDWSKRGIVCQDTSGCVFVPDQLSDTEKGGVLRDNGKRPCDGNVIFNYIISHGLFN